ncbi:MAG: menaquinone biosynthesis decarboxylase [Epsilonproteobacteria bacterium]|nr:menaquinone biosynthesis decarboxylase [Campylobacterota bacterium]OIO13703.1 MAG: menaquinone biosynthesis decarboxylase [Helicobacteraceae bacterium CG1_02_36_14]PIP10646.1 MAG: menaquinone biosynthesis decarboxylase [Sulfurimonas sp. CG23_combo_of_CG06-09_8_20_14_all_36_33]PIS25619.1 MAG: menaquinone biosynthesis decarboxylase [Sulfurimonas sp. CG08_land_8_20_14_0_20_36_33]PIU34926.1 MAG: menaquinone biosynthesis decarboxylase [Sulfurimonas sp. CG07_land_8_20_14_0_80_36_56]PIV04639.1 MAG
MQRTINLLKKENELKIIEDELDIYLEVSHLAYAEVKKKDGGKALLFTNVIDKKSGTKFEEPVLMNVFGSYKRCELLFGRSIESVADEITKLLHMKPPAGFMNKISMASELFSLKNIFPKRLKGEGACQKVKYLNEEIDLYKLPVLTTWEQDGGPFITMGQVYTQSLDGELVNLGMYRLQVYDKNHLGMHWQIHKDSSHFFDQYQKAGKKMPVTVAIGGNPLYTWCATAPLPYGVNELLMYGLITKEPAKLVKSITTPLYIPEDVDYVIEGWVDSTQMKVEGPFGDHTGYYTLKEPYPVMEVSAITTKKKRVFLATVVGKPPLEDKYMGWATGKIFFPLLKTTVPDLLDYHMPENAGFHNLILAKMQPHYKGHAKQFMHAFWGAGQMSFVKHAIFVDEKAPRLDNYEAFATYVLNRFTPKSMFISEGILDALDHSSPESLVGGKLGIDATASHRVEPPQLLGDEELFMQVKELIPDAVNLHQFMRRTNNPITVISLNKTKNAREYFEALVPLSPHLRVVIFVDEAKNDLFNAYMLIWRVTNNIDAARDIFVSGLMVGVDGTNKTPLDGFLREWPDDVECTQSVVNSLKQKGLFDLDETLYNKFQL